MEMASERMQQRDHKIVSKKVYENHVNIYASLNMLIIDTVKEYFLTEHRNLYTGYWGVPDQ